MWRKYSAGRGEHWDFHIFPKTSENWAPYVYSINNEKFTSFLSLFLWFPLKVRNKRVREKSYFNTKIKQEGLFLSNMNIQMI